MVTNNTKHRFRRGLHRLVTWARTGGAGAIISTTLFVAVMYATHHPDLTRVVGTVASVMAAFGVPTAVAIVNTIVATAVAAIAASTYFMMRRYCRATYTVPLLSSAEISQALADGRVEVALQPIYNLHTNTVDGFESLVRLHHDTYGVVLPSQFTLTECDTTTSRQITEYVAKKTAEYYQSFLRDGYDFQMSINLYASDISNPLTVPSITSIIKQAVSTHDMPPERLTIELPPDTKIGCSATASKTVAGIKSLDVKIALDDYGPRLAAFGYVDRTYVDGVKIDKALTEKMHMGEDNVEHVRSIVHDAHTMGASATAKHVQTPQAVANLRSANCDYVQGYLVAPPMTFEHARVWITTQKVRKKG